MFDVKVAYGFRFDLTVEKGIRDERGLASATMACTGLYEHVQTVLFFFRGPPFRRDCQLWCSGRWHYRPPAPIQSPNTITAFTLIVVHPDMHLYPKRACLDGLEMEIFKLVSYSATPEQWEEWLRVPLEHAAARGNLDLFNKLLGAGANGSAGWRGCRGRTLLDAAAVGGNEDIISGLLRVGAQPDVKVVSCSSKRSALYTATMLGHEAVARRLVVAGADVNFQDPLRKRTVLHEAVHGQHEQLVTELLIGGANPSSRFGDDGFSPLHLAAAGGFDGIVSTLLLRGADKDALDHTGRTPLIWAADRGHLSVVKNLLAAGADASVQGSDGCSALENAAFNGHSGVIKAIAGYGVDVKAHDEEGYTALHAAAQFDQAGAVDALVEAGADVGFKNNAGRTPLATAAYNSNCNATLALLRHGANVDIRDNTGDTLLHKTCYGRSKGLEAAVDLLLRWGADETALTDDGLSPAEMLDVENEDESIPMRSTQDEIDRTRLLLSRAPADRTWRRRGWLVMLRSRGSEARTASSDGNNENGGGSSNSGCDGQGGGSKMARARSGGGAESGTHGNGGAWSGTGGEGEGWGGVVELLLGLEVEGVFRTVVGFL